MIVEKDLNYINTCKNIAIFGSSGAIGSGFIDFFSTVSSVETIYSFSRSSSPKTTKKNKHFHFDILDEHALQNIALSIPKEIEFDIIIIATGSLHIDNIMPEKSIRHYESKHAQLFYMINTVGPSLIMKYFYQKLSKHKKSILASLCARIGSISDNRLGGWYSYRASKAALCMMIKSLSIEIKRTNPNAICIGIHPGTVKSKLSEPFQRSINPKKILIPSQSVLSMIHVLDSLTTDQSGLQFAYDGTLIPT